jgi:hypothetical protein
LQKERDDNKYNKFLEQVLNNFLFKKEDGTIISASKEEIKEGEQYEICVKDKEDNVFKINNKQLIDKVLELNQRLTSIKNKEKTLNEIKGLNDEKNALENKVIRLNKYTNDLIEKNNNTLIKEKIITKYLTEQEKYNIMSENNAVIFNSNKEIKEIEKQIKQLTKTLPKSNEEYTVQKLGLELNGIYNQLQQQNNRQRKKLTRSYSDGKMNKENITKYNEGLGKLNKNAKFKEMQLMQQKIIDAKTQGKKINSSKLLELINKGGQDLKIQKQNSLSLMQQLISEQDTKRSQSAIGSEKERSIIQGSKSTILQEDRSNSSIQRSGNQNKTSKILGANIKNVGFSKNGLNTQKSLGLGSNKNNSIASRKN